MDTSSSPLMGLFILGAFFTKTNWLVSKTFLFSLFYFTGLSFTHMVKEVFLGARYFQHNTFYLDYKINYSVFMHTLVQPVMHIQKGYGVMVTGQAW